MIRVYDYRKEKAGAEPILNEREHVCATEGINNYTEWVPFTDNPLQAIKYKHDLLGSPTKVLLIIDIKGLQFRLWY